MVKLTITFLGAFFYSLIALSMDNKDIFARWKTVKLAVLCDELKAPVNNESHQHINAQKQKFVATNQEKYAFQQRVLNELCLKTGGLVRATRDPEVAQEDPNKFLSSGSSDFTAKELDERWDRIIKAMKGK